MDGSWLQFAIWTEELAVQCRAHQEGREATPEELAAANKRAFETFVNTGTQHTLAIARAAEVTRPRRGFFSWLFG